MSSRISSIVIEITFVILAWFRYVTYPLINNLAFAIFITLLTVRWMLYQSKEMKLTQTPIMTHKMDQIRAAFYIISATLFIAFIVISLTLGGTAASDQHASLRNEDYEVGQYYLRQHGTFTPVTYSVWINMKVTEIIVLSAIAIAIIWNFIHTAITKGIQYTMTGKYEDISNQGSNIALKTKIKFIIWCVFILGFVGLMIWSFFI